MGLFAPWFLAGLLAVGLPVWLHLLRHYNRKPTPFSSLRFFERRVQSSVKHRRLKYLLLLALRLAVLILLAWAFANPYVNRTVPAESSRVLTVIAIDRSFSMRYQNRLGKAKQRAAELVRGLSSGRFAQIMTVDSRAQLITQATKDKQTLLAAIDSVQPSDLASSFGELARALRVIESAGGQQVQAHFISDFQQTSMPAAFPDLQVGSHTTLDLVAVAANDAPNWTVETVSAPSHVYDPSRTRVVATIAGWHTPAAQLQASLAVDGKTAATKRVDVPANGRAQVEFTSFDVAYGSHRGEVRLEPHDSLRDDDSFPFPVERADPRKILFLYQGSRAAETFFYRTAIESSVERGFTVQALPYEQVSGVDLSRYAFIVLGDTGTLADATEQQLRGFARKGGSLLITLGPQAVRTGRVPVTQERITGNRVTQRAAMGDGRLAAPQGIESFDNVQFWGTARLSIAPGAHVLAKLSDGSPLISEEALGEGRVLIFTSGFDNSLNDFPLHASFLPFVTQTAKYLAGVEETHRSVVAGTAVELRRTANQGNAADVIGPDGKRRLSLSDAAKTASFDLEDDGFYEIVRADGRRLLTAVHADRRESDLTRTPGETLDLWRKLGAGEVGVKTAGQSENRPWSLWRYLLLFALAAAVAESLVSHRYLKEERQT